MAKVKERNLTFRPSQSPDVVGYRLHYVSGVGPAADTDAFKVLTNITPGADGLIRVPLGATLGSTLAEGRYSFGVVAVDDAGNTSDIFTADAWSNVELDVEVPLPPSDGGIEDA